MADIKPRFTKGQRTIVNYKIPGPIRESAHDSQPYHPDPYNPPNRPPYAILPSHQTTLIPTSPPTPPPPNHKPSFGGGTRPPFGWLYICSFSPPPPPPPPLRHTRFPALYGN